MYVCVYVCVCVCACVQDRETETHTETEIETERLERGRTAPKTGIRVRKQTGFHTKKFQSLPFAKDFIKVHYVRH